MNRRDLVKRLEESQWYLKRHGNAHDIYWNDEQRKAIPVKRHKLSEDDIRYILKEAGIK